MRWSDVFRDSGFWHEPIVHVVGAIWALLLLPFILRAVAEPVVWICSRVFNKVAVDEFGEPLIEESAQ